MFSARLVCSDERCAAELTAEAATLATLETLACECGCGLAVIGWPDHMEEPTTAVLTLRMPDAGGGLAEAA